MGNRLDSHGGGRLEGGAWSGGAGGGHAKVRECWIPIVRYIEFLLH